MIWTFCKPKTATPAGVRMRFGKRQINIDAASIEKFFAKVDKTDTCWFWTGLKNKDGYGAFSPPKQRATIGAHRVAFALYGGVTTDEKYCVCHSCDTPACVNPEHLFAGSLSDNSTDRNQKQRNSPRKGERNGRAKITASDVTDIREAYKKGNLSQPALARKYGLTHCSISRLIRGQSWAHIP